MVEGKVISIGNVAYVLGMNPKKLHRWYQEVLSGYSQAITSGQIGKHDLRVRDKGIEKVIKVPILKEEHLGSYMAIDEKTIDGECYSILSNRESGKIALMANTLKTKYLVKLLGSFDNKMQVKSLTRDMAQNYEWLGRQSFMNAYQVADKFHVIKHALESLQAIRIRYRQQELEKRRKAKEDFYDEQQAKKWEAHIDRKEFKKQPFKYTETQHPNGDSTLQLLARSRGLLFKLPGEWSDHQKQRAQILFDIYPEIQLAYSLIVELRQWYRKTKKSVELIIKEKKILLWLEKVNDVYIYELDNLSYLLKNHLPFILNYFRKNETNAAAEALNSQIQRFVNINYGARNQDFFLFRLSTYFS
ncbi:MAG: transposase [Bacteroidota bacterium]